MIKNYLSIIALSFISISYAQKHDVELIVNKTKEGFVFTVTNHTDVQQEIVLTLKIENLIGYKKPITKLIPAKATIEVIKLYFIKGKYGKYSSNYIYKPKPTKEEQTLKVKQLKEKLLEKVGDITKGIVVFSKDGCTRSQYTTKYLLDNKIEFKFLNTSKNKEYKDLMWILINEENQGTSLNRVTMPVVLINGKLFHNIKDLKLFVTNLDKNKIQYNEKNLIFKNLN